MSEIPFSAAVQMAWQIAGDFALHCGGELIESRHLLYGISSLEKIASTGAPEGGMTPKQLASLKEETERLNELTEQYGVDLRLIRRKLREADSATASSAGPAKGQVARRSPATRQIFAKATELSQSSDLPEVDIFCLLSALLDNSNAELTSLLGSTPNGIRALIRSLQVTREILPQVATSLVTGVTDLDFEPETVHQPLQISETLSANTAIGSSDGAGADRVAWLSEFAWEFGTEGEMNLLLQRAAEELLRVFPKAEHDVVLITDRADQVLLLKAFSPQTWMPRVSMTCVRRAMEEKKGFIWKRGDDLTASQAEAKVETGIYVPLVVNAQSLGAICLDTTISEQSFTCADLEFVTCFAHQVALALANHELQMSLKQNAEVMQRLLTNFSPKVRTRLLQRAQLGRLTLGGEQSVVSILCSDIRGFTRLSAGMSADEVVAMLNEYFTALVDCIFRHDGTVDKFVGDSILAVFGSPEADPKHHQKAVSAAVEMQRIVHSVSQARAAKSQKTCEFGIGVHAGEVLHGFIGSPERMEFTVIGEAVNLAARYSDAAKASQILISPEVFQRVWTMFQAEKTSISTKHEGELPAYLLKVQ